MFFKYLEFKTVEKAVVNEIMENLTKDSDVEITSLAVGHYYIVYTFNFEQEFVSRM